MQIMAALFILALLILVTLIGVLIGSLLLGGMLGATKRARIIAPIFLVVIPVSVVGALAGGILIGYFAVKANDNLILLGPLGGIIAGGVAGLAVGIAGALFWWWRISRANRRTKDSRNKLPNV
jgi:hypothetical protein